MDLTTIFNEFKSTFDEKHKAEIERLEQKMVEYTDRQESEIKTLGEARESTNDKLEKADEQLRTLGENYAEIKGMVDALDRMGGRVGTGEDTPASWGEEFTKSDQFQSMLTRNADRSDPVEIKSPFERKQSTGLTSGTSGYGNIGTLIEPQALGELIRKPRLDFSLRQFLRIFPTQSSSVEWVEMVGFKNLYSELTAAVSATTATTLTVDSTSGFYAGMKIDIGGTSATVQSVDSATGLTLTAQIGATKSVGVAVTSDELGFTPHGGLKPQANIQFTEKSEPVGTIAHWIPAHKQTLSDAPQIQGVINTEMVAGLDDALDRQIIRGPGGAPNLTGLLNNTNIQNAGTMTGTGGQGMIEHIRKMKTKAMLAGYPPDAVVVYPTDWETMELAKATDNQYIQMNISDGRESRLWRVPVVESTALKPNEVLMGSFGLGAYLLDREQASLQVSDSHSDFFTRNMVAILAEARVGMAVPRPESFVKGAFA